MNRIVRNIPNAITCGNLLCGCLAIVKAFEGDLVWAAYLVGIAAVLDFFDGFAARMLKVSSPIGKDLDSLADMVTFGVVPGVVMYQLLKLSIIASVSSGNNGIADKAFSCAVYVGFLPTIFSAIRLAKFNNDTRQTESFIGLPTPANAIFICSLPLIFFKQFAQRYDLVLDLVSPFNLIIMTILLSFLLVAPLPLFSLKFKSFGWKSNEIRFIFLILAVALIGFLQFMGIPLVILLYILLSIVNNLLAKRAPSK